MLDANTLIELLGGKAEKIGARAMTCDEGDLAVSAIAFAEVALGSWQGKRPSQVVLDRLASRIAVLPFDHVAAKRYAQLPLKRGSYDRLIAAHALATNLILVTNNERDFSDVPELVIENWGK